MIPENEPSDSVFEGELTWNGYKSTGYIIKVISNKWDINKLDISGFCRQSYPCQHDIAFVFNDKPWKKIMLNGIRIYAIIKLLKSDDIDNDILKWVEDHFAYLKESERNFYSNKEIEKIIDEML